MCWKEAFARASIGEDFAARTNDLTATRIIIFRISSAPVGPDDIRLILNGPGFEQSQPVVDPDGWPTGKDGEQIGSELDVVTENLWEPEVIADGRRKLKFPTGDRHRFRSGCHCLTAGAEGMAFGVNRDFPSGRVEKHCRIPAVADQASQQVDLELARDLRQCGPRVFGESEIQGETSGKHFRKDNQGIRLEICGGQQGANFRVIGSFGLPHNIKLEDRDVHECNTRRR